MDARVIQQALRQTAGRLSEEIRSRPLVARAVGGLLLRRLKADDWIKSPLLTSFLRPMTLPHLWRPSPSEIRHVLCRDSEMGRGATSLDALEETLKDFDRRSVGGVGQWFKELAGLRGYWFDKRMQTLAFEMYAAVAMEWADVTKLERRAVRKTPDFVARARGLIIVADAKLLLGKYWPLKIVHTMLRTLEESFGLAEVGGVIVIPCRRDIEPELLDAEVEKLTVDSLVSAVAALAGGTASFRVTPNLVMERATVWDRFYGIRAFAAHLPGGGEEWRALFDSLSAGVDAIARASEEAWGQCDAYVLQESGSERRLDVAFLAAEYMLLHQDLAATQRLVWAWLESRVWPVRPQRSVVLASTEMLNPVWFVNPLLRRAQGQSPAPRA